MTIHNLHIAIQAIDFSALFYLVGLLISKTFVLPSDVFTHDRITQKWQQQLFASLILFSITGLALSVVRVMLMSGDNVFNTIQLLPLVIQKTHYGMVWLIHLVAIVTLWVVSLLFSKNSRKWPAWLMLFIILTIMWSYSATSHAADEGDFSISEINDALHMLVTAIWGGSILVGGCFIFPYVARLPACSLILIDCMKRLSGLLLITVPVVLLSGILNVVLHSPNYKALLSDGYGKILIIKLSFVILMLVVGAFNRYRIQSDTSKGQIASKLYISFSVDIVLVLGALISASILIQTMPA